MRPNKNILLLPAFMLAASLLSSSCKKAVNAPDPDPFYEVSVNGFIVTFKNQSKESTSYKWDFGDGTTSTDENPTHTYQAKGKYVPTLYATNARGTKEASTVLFISKSTAVKMDDNSLSDWDTVTTNVVTAGAGAGKFIKSKYDYDGNNVYVYFEQSSSIADGNIYDLYIDADNDLTTGLITGDIPNGAYEVLLEGTIFDGIDAFTYTGDQTSFSFAPSGVTDFITLGTSEESNGVLKFEFAIKRSKIKGLTGTGMKIGVQLSDSGYSLIGTSPDQGSNAFFLDMSE